MKIPSWIAVILISGIVIYGLHSEKEAAPLASTSTVPANTASRVMEPSFALPDASHYLSRDMPSGPAHQAAYQPLFELAPNGMLQVDAMTPARLEVLMSGLPEAATWQDRQRLKEKVKAGLPEHAQANAVQILDAYVAYREAEKNLEAQALSVGAATPESMQEQLVALRRRHLGEELADAMFAAKEAQERFGIEVARIDADPNLNASEKLARIDVLQRTLPAETAALVQNGPDSGIQAVYALDAQVTALRHNGASETEIWKLRQEKLGTEEAQAVTEMETQSLRWTSRYKAFAEQKRIRLSAGISADQIQATTEALLRQHYAEQELDTARAYDAKMLK
jgi:lipase chaperone LimK